MITNREQYVRMAKWIDALESGHYEQVTNTLRGPIPLTGKIGHCCLGVLCENLADENIVDRDRGPLDYDTYLYVYGMAHLKTELIHEVRQLVGLEDADETVLIRMNDGFDPTKAAKDQGMVEIRKHSFKEIAQHLREKFLVPYGPVEGK